MEYTELYPTFGLRIAFDTPTPRRTDWSCAGHPDPEVFQPTDPDTLVEAQAVCAGCPARAECLALGLQRREWGVWGGVLLEHGRRLDRQRAPGRPPKGLPAAGAA